MIKLITAISNLRASMLTTGMVEYKTRGTVTTGNVNGYRGKVFSSRTILIRKNSDGSYMVAFKEKERGTVAKIVEFRTIAEIKDHFTR